MSSPGLELGEHLAGRVRDPDLAPWWRVEEDLEPGVAVGRVELDLQPGVRELRYRGAAAGIGAPETGDGRTCEQQPGESEISAHNLSFRRGVVVRQPINRALTVG